MPHWLVFAISVLALGVSIAGLLSLVWLAIVRPASFIITPVEVAYIAGETVLIPGRSEGGATLAAPLPVASLQV